jgi:pyridoxine 5-phosphate synthase
MTKLSVNINKFATLRNARGGNNPNILQVALDCEQFGADGITVHPRPDQRHIRYQDVLDLSPRLHTEFNIEGYPDQQYLQLVTRVKPIQATLVPDPPGVLTSDTGWDTLTHQDFLREVIASLKSQGIRVSLFVNPVPEMVEGAAKAGTDRIELYTGPYAHHYTQDPQAAIAPYIQAAEKAHQLGLGINAGHDLSLENLAYFYQHIPYLAEVSIGHALICDALYLGLKITIAQYQQCLGKQVEA